MDQRPRATGLGPVISHAADTGTKKASSGAQHYGSGEAGPPLLSRMHALGLVRAGAGARETENQHAAQAFWSQVPLWARSPDIYAVMIVTHDAETLISERAATEVAGSAAKADALPPGLPYMLAWRVECFPKPMVSVLAGALDGAVIGLTGYGTHRIATDGYQWAVPPLHTQSMPALAGMAHTLARLPGARGMELALTGRTVGPAEALRLGLVTHWLPGTAIPAVVAGLAEGMPVDPLLDGLPATGLPAADANGAAVARCFAAGSIDSIMAALKFETGPDLIWAADALAALERQPRWSLTVAHDLIRAAATLDIRDSLIMSNRISASLSHVASDAHQNIDAENAMTRLFAPPESGDLLLPARADIENGRF